MKRMRMKFIVSNVPTWKDKKLKHQWVNVKILETEQ